MSGNAAVSRLTGYYDLLFRPVKARGILRMRGGIVLLLAVALGLTACASTSAGIGKREQLVALPMSELPLPPGVKPDDDVRSYILGPKDKISVNVFGDETLSMAAVQVNGGGQIDMPEIGEVRAQGRTTTELAQEIAGRLGSVLKEPRVSINIVDPVSQAVTVDGAIGKPGLYPVVGRTTLQQIVAQAGSTTEYSVLDKVVIMRRIEGKTMIALYNLKDIRQGTYRDPEVFAGDTILVGASEARRWFKDILQALPMVFLLVDKVVP